MAAAETQGDFLSARRSALWRLFNQRNFRFASQTDDRRQFETSSCLLIGGFLSPTIPLPQTHYSPYQLHISLFLSVSVQFRTDVCGRRFHLVSRSGLQQRWPVSYDVNGNGFVALSNRAIFFHSSKSALCSLRAK